MPKAVAPQRWSPLHDLALLYFALMHGVNAKLDPLENVTLQEALAQRHPEAAPQEVRGAIRDAMLAYMSTSGEHMLEISVVSLHQELGREQRLAVLDDLASMATSDGNLVPAEATFIQHLARRWEVEQEMNR